MEEPTAALMEAAATVIANQALAPPLMDTASQASALQSTASQRTVSLSTAERPCTASLSTEATTATEDTA